MQITKEQEIKINNLEITKNELRKIKKIKKHEENICVGVLTLSIFPLFSSICLSILFKEPMSFPNILLTGSLATIGSIYTYKKCEKIIDIDDKYSKAKAEVLKAKEEYKNVMGKKYKLVNNINKQKAKLEVNIEGITRLINSKKPRKVDGIYGYTKNQIIQDDLSIDNKVKKIGRR